MTLNSEQQRGRISQDQIKVHWQHPRHEQENPVLLVWPNPLRENWAAEILHDGIAVVVSRTVLWKGSDGEIRKHSEPVDSLDEVPGYVKEALLAYDSNYGPVEHVVNPANDDDQEPPKDSLLVFDDYFSKQEQPS